MTTYRFSDDPDEMDRELIHVWLSTDAYWALGRSRDVQDRAIDGSLPFGMFDASGAQVAFARLVTDSANFAWLCDVYVSPEVRGGGVGVALIDGISRHLDGLGIKRTLLATRDAHGLYEKFGFEPLAEPEKWMIRQA